MTVSLLSRFQGCLGMTLAATHGDRPLDCLSRWSIGLQSSPYYGPAASWLDEGLIGPSINSANSVNEWLSGLVVLALWHHEYPDGFRGDLGRWLAALARQFPDQVLSREDQAWLQIWQRLLTLILSERFHPSQLPPLLRSPFLTDPLGLPPAIIQDCQAGLTAIATALEQSHGLDGQKIKTSRCSPADNFSGAIAWAIYCWADTPAQPLLSLHQCQSSPLGAHSLPFVAALSGAYNGQEISRHTLTMPATSRSQVNDFACQLLRQWSGSLGSLGPFLELSSLTSAGPLATQHRSGLKLISQQDYVQFS